MSRGSERTLLVVDDPAGRWAVDASVVQSVAPRTSFTKTQPIDVMERLGHASLADGEDARVVVVRTPTGSLPLLARGAVRMCSAQADHLAELPALLLAAGASRALRWVVLDGPHAPLFVLAPERLPPRPSSSAPSPQGGPPRSPTPC